MVVTAMPGKGTNHSYVEITEEPSSKSTRFRYECEARSGGSIQGKTSTTDNKTYPTIKVQNYAGPLVVVVSLVTTDETPMPHPHALVGTDCKQDVCTVKVRDSTQPIVFKNLGVQCRKKKELVEALKLRKQIRVDPYRTGFSHAEKPKLSEIDLSAVRLCFQVFLPDASGKYQKALEPVCSEAIYDKKSAGELFIASYLPASCQFKGNEDMIFLTGKLPKDVQAVFYEGTSLSKAVWQKEVTPTNKETHGGIAMRIKAPMYDGPNMHKKTANCHILLRKKDKPSECSSPVSFTYYADGGLNYDMPRKRKAELEAAHQQQTFKHSKQDIDDSYRDNGEPFPPVPETISHLGPDQSAFSDSSSLHVASTVIVDSNGNQYSNPYMESQAVLMGYVPISQANITFVKTEGGSYAASSGQQTVDLSGFEFSEEWMNATLEKQKSDPCSDIYVPSTLSEFLKKNGITLTEENNVENQVTTMQSL